MENKDELTAGQDFQEFLGIPKRIMDAIFEIWSHDTEDHNCRSYQKDRLTWRLNN